MAPIIQIGDEARDRITGFQGIVVGKTEWLNGCSRLGIQSKDLHEGKPLDAQWFDEIQLDLVSPRALLTREPETAPTGGPRPDPSRRNDPR